ncbi:MAG: mechanosensitive ion channel family protein [Candidatus Azobacteroides pseudotrichonymphae]|jgi:small-conductance mechanosensitive channel|nr:MAG: mechanosensitive ion channel family protein [Candidatus Azobacteroides pseudotrichonymphae]
MVMFCHSLIFYWIEIVPLLFFPKILETESFGIERTQSHIQTSSAKLKLVETDSLYDVISEIPVIIEKDTLFYIYKGSGGLRPIQRAIQIQSTIEKLGKKNGINPDKVCIISDNYTTNITYDGKPIMTLTDKDAYCTQMSRRDLAVLNKTIIVKALKTLQKKHRLENSIKNIVLVLLILTIQYILFKATNKGYWNLRKKVKLIRKKRLKPFFIKNYELLNVGRQIRIIYALLKALRFVVITIQLLIFFPIIFSIFPQTENLSIQIFSYIWSPIKKIGVGIVQYIPNLFTIIIIWIIFYYVIKGVRALAEEIEKERLKLHGFYPDWAKPTFGIIRFLLYAFMIALIYPYLPHSESDAFKGVSVLVGLIFSLGSSSAISNLVAGIIITYMRPFKIGDMIKINDIMGNVIEKTPIVTRILTIKNEIVTISNATVINAQTTNLSESARTNGLILHFDVTFGYDTPWRIIHKILLDGAEATPNILKEPHPFVLETSFGDFYTTYQINAYINDADKLIQSFSELRQNIQDKFSEAGLSMVAPHYYKQNVKMTREAK